MTKKDRKFPYQYDYDGMYMPEKTMYHSNTFSVGIFQWIPKSSKSGLKRTAVVKRIRGYVSNPQEVYDRAEELCDKLDREYYLSLNN